MTRDRYLTLHKMVRFADKKFKTSEDKLTKIHLTIGYARHLKNHFIHLKTYVLMKAFYFTKDAYHLNNTYHLRGVDLE